MTTSLSVRINKETKEMLEQLSGKLRASMTVVLQDAVKEFHRKKFWEDVNRAFDEMRSNPEAGMDYDNEARLFDAAVADGLDGPGDQEK